jgi:hypothetical protein
MTKLESPTPEHAPEIPVPDEYLTAIGRVCVQWGALEGMIEISIIKLANLDLYDPRALILTSHLSVPLRLDILKSLVQELRINYPQLSRFDEIAPRLAQAQSARNRIIHGRWSLHPETGEVTVSRATARGTLKTKIEPVSLSDLEKIAKNIEAVSIDLYQMIVGKQH